MYLRFDVGVPACTYKKFETSLAVVDSAGGKKGDAKPSAFLKEKRGLRRWRTSFLRFDKKIRYRQSDLFDPTKLTLVARHLLCGTLLSRSPLNRRLIDFSLFRCLFFSKLHPFSPYVLQKHFFLRCSC